MRVHGYVIPLLGLLCLGCGIGIADGGSAGMDGEVVVLEDASFAMTQSGSWFVEFYAPW